jgi:methionine salvage enolase-phosphatase E1
MEINELRIGNYVNIEGDVVKVKEIYEKSIHYANGEYESYATEDFIHPIELTGDILINIGFKKGYNEIYSKTIKDDFYEYNVSYQNVKDNKYSFVAYGYKNGELKRQIILDNIQYLHELQNIFFSFTNQELNIKL